MAINLKQFLHELYEEHLEEAAFHYESRCAWLQDKEIGWQDLIDHDVSMEAHLDALVVGTTTALNICIDSLGEAEFSQLHIIVRLFCRHQSIDNLAKLWIDFDFDDAEKIQAIADALKWECPQQWLPHLLHVFSTDKVDMFPVLAPAVAYHSRHSGQALLSALTSCKDEHLTVMVWAISCCDKSIKNICINEIRPLLTHQDIELVEQVAKTLLIMGDETVIDQCHDKVARLPYIYALSGGKSANQMLLRLAKEGIADGDSLMALGLSGDISAVPNLLAYLKHPDYAEMAAQALQLFSGANLYGNVHIAEKVEEDELFENEVEDFKMGVLPKNIDGNPFGDEIQQLSLDQQLWQSWFQQHKDQFVEGLRYRNGQLMTPGEILNGLVSNQTPYKIRQFLYEELRINYDVNIAFNADDLVYMQKNQLNEIYQWVEQNKASFKPGSWYFNGTEILDHVQKENV